MKVEVLRWLLGSAAALGLLTTALVAAPGDAPAPTPIHTTLVFFADHPLSSSAWQALFTALHSMLLGGMPETRVLDPSPMLLRGDLFIPGTEVQSPIVIFLHGDCVLSPQPRLRHYGAALGWVKEFDGIIQPFVNVDCTEIGRVLGPRTSFLTKQERVPAMAEAMASVVVHEWIHIAEQNPRHAHTGIAKASFSADDLLRGFRENSHSSREAATAVASTQPSDNQTAMVKIPLPR